MGMSTDPVLFYGLIAEEGSEAHERIRELADENDLGDYPANEDCQASFIGYIDYCDYAVFVTDSYTISWNGKTTINPETLKVQPDWDAKLAKFCEEFGLKLDEKPQWRLTARTC
jgi:hypothetical protein